MPPRDVYTAPVTDDRRMWDLWLSGLHQPSIVAAEEAGVFSSLADAPATAAELAARLNFDERATMVLVRLLAALRLLDVRDGRYQLTDEALRHGRASAIIRVLDGPALAEEVVWPETKMLLGLCGLLGMVGGVVVVSLQSSMRKLS